MIDHQTMVQVFAVFISAITLVQFVAYGAQDRKIGPLVGLGVSVMWIIYCSPWISDQWGIQILNVSLIYVHGRNFWKWKNDKLPVTKTT